MAAERKHILVVDDDELAREIIVRMLVELGHSAAEAGDGEAAIQVIEAQPFDAVFLDILMPRSDGFEVLTWLRQTGRLELPVVVFSEANAKHNLDLRSMTEDLGAIKAFDKPITIEKVRDALDAIRQQ